MKKIRNKALLIMMTALIMCSIFTVSAFAAGPGGGTDSGGFGSESADTLPSASNTGDVAGAVEDTWNAAKGQIKQVVNNVVFPIIDLILAVLFFTKVAMTYMDYRKHGQFEWAPPAILLATLIFSLTCPLYIWNILGM